MHCPRDGALLTPLAVGVTQVERCPTCRGVWGERAAVESLAGVPIASRVAHVSIGALGTEGAAPCPRCGGPLEPEETRAAPGHELLGCPRCASVWLDAETLSTLRAARTSSRPAPIESRTRPTTRDEPAAPEGATAADLAPVDPARRRVEHRIFAPGPAIELAILAASFLLAWGFVATSFGDAVATLLRIQFHELGHALVAWSTGRRALPLPFGWTSWSFERSFILVAMELLFPVLLAVHGLREKKPMAVAVAVGLGTLFATGLAIPLTVSEEWLVAGGNVGEALLPALALLAFHAPMPERARWDFWRWPLAIAAIIALVSVVGHHADIASGARPVPFGSFVTGRAGDGDLERLVNDHGWPEASLRPFFGTLSHLALGLGVVPLALLLGLRWLHARSRAGAPPQGEVHT